MVSSDIDLWRFFCTVKSAPSIHRNFLPKLTSNNSSRIKCMLSVYSTDGNIWSPPNIHWLTTYAHATNSTPPLFPGRSTNGTTFPRNYPDCWIPTHATEPSLSTTHISPSTITESIRCRAIVSNIQHFTGNEKLQEFIYTKGAFRNHAHFAGFVCSLLFRSASCGADSIAV